MDPMDVWCITVFQLQVTVLVTGDQEYKYIFKASTRLICKSFKGLSWQILMPQTAPQKVIPCYSKKTDFVRFYLI